MRLSERLVNCQNEERLKLIKERLDKNSIFKKLQEKEHERFKKFEEIEQARRLVDLEEERFRQKQKEELLSKAREQLFQQQDDVKAFNRQLLLCDYITTNQKLQEFNKTMAQSAVQLDKKFHDLTLSQV